MNLIKRVFYSNGLRSLSIPTNTCNCNNFSTSADVCPTENEHEQPDKLYKTVQLEMRAYEPVTMKSYTKFASMAAECLGIRIGKCWAPKKPFHHRDGLTILKSQFVHKKHRVQYEVRTYFNFMTFHYMTGSTADTFLEYIERNLPEGIALKVTKVAIEKLPEELLSRPPQISIEKDSS